MDIWTGSGIWQGWRLTIDHSASSYNQPVLVNPDGDAFGPGDIFGEVVGLSEAADILGWQKQQIGVYMTRGSFPQPIRRLASTPIWTRKQIEDYKESRINGQKEDPMYTVEYRVLPHKEIRTSNFKKETEMNEWIEQSKRLGIEIVKVSRL